VHPPTRTLLAKYDSDTLSLEERAELQWRLRRLDEQLAPPGDLKLTLSAALVIGRQSMWYAFVGGVVVCVVMVILLIAAKRFL
jgi:hypothetical protein